MKENIELLAPAGCMEAFYAAINSGADAVYLGGKNFNARQYSDNFEDEKLKNLIKYAHNKSAKVYVTVNIILKDSEIFEALNYVRFLYESDVDAVIVQDLGLIYLINKYIPDLCVNVSTQATVYDEYGVEFFDSIKINRFILSRELSIEQIKDINKHTGKKIETFIHGALCMCYSGQCYMSSFLGGRSGNRGKCAQPCRLNYSFYNEVNKSKISSFEEKPLLSLKDFKAGEAINKLIDAGVTTFKIEGRMKNPEYTAIVVEFYRHLIDNYLKSEQYNTDNLEKKVEAVFSRGFTNGYLNAGKEDMLAGVSTGSKGADIDDIKEEIRDRLEPFSELRRNSIDFDIKIRINKKIKLTAKDEKNEIVVYSEELVETSIKNPVTYDMVSEQLNKLGNSTYKLNNINIELDDNAFARKSTINQLRRDAVDALYEKSTNIYNRKEIEAFSQNDILTNICRDELKPKISFKINSIEDLKYIDNKIARIYVPYGFDLNKIADIKCEEKYLWIPNIVSQSEYQSIAQDMSKIEGLFDGVCVNNIGTLEFFKQNSKLKIHCGYFFNIINTPSIAMLQEKNVNSITFSIESNIKDIESICSHSQIVTELVAYSYIQLMTMKTCPFSVIKGCKSYGNCASCEYKTGYKLNDRKNINFPIERENRISKLYNSVPLTTIGKTNEFLDLNINYYFIDSKWAKNIGAVIDVLYKEIHEEYVADEEYDILEDNSFTRGHYFKNIL